MQGAPDLRVREVDEGMSHPAGGARDAGQRPERAFVGERQDGQEASDQEREGGDRREHLRVPEAPLPSARAGTLRQRHHGARVSGPAHSPVDEGVPLPAPAPTTTAAIMPAAQATRHAATSGMSTANTAFPVPQRCAWASPRMATTANQTVPRRPPHSGSARKRKMPEAYAATVSVASNRRGAARTMRRKTW